MTGKSEFVSIKFNESNECATVTIGIDNYIVWKKVYKDRKFYDVTLVATKDGTR